MNALSDYPGKKKWITRLVAVILALSTGVLVSGCTSVNEVESEYKQEELAPIRLNGKWGYINTQGEIPIEPEFKKVEDFGCYYFDLYCYNGFASVEKDGKLVYINTKGKVIPEKEVEIIDWPIFEICPRSLDFFYENGKYGLTNPQGEVIIPPRLEGMVSFASSTVDGEIVYFAAVKENGKWGFINHQLKEIIPLQFEEVRTSTYTLPCGKEAVHNLIAVKENGKWGCFNTEGKLLVKPRFEDIWANNVYRHNLIAVKENGKWGYINENGEVIIAPRFDRVENFARNGLAEVVEDGKTGFINVKGEFVVFRDKICDLDVLKNPQGKIIWPKKNIGKNCNEPKS